jgi:hypothetical protein
MPRHRHPRSIDKRVAADRPISADLLAAAASAPLTFADGYRAAWFKAAEQITERGLVLVYDEEAEWYDEHADDLDAEYEPPTLPQRVLWAMADGQEADRLALGSTLTSIMARVLRPEREDLYTLVRLGLTLERLMVELADAIRIGEGAVVDAHLPAERADGWRWAA